MDQSHKAGKLVHTSLIPMRWGDMDALGHVNNTIYFRYMEQTRVEYLECAGYALEPKGITPLIINASCTFLVPLTYPGVVEVKMFFGVPGRSSISTRYEIGLQGDSTLYATGDAKVVWADMASGKSVPIPEDLRSRLSDIDV